MISKTRVNTDDTYETVNSSNRLFKAGCSNTDEILDRVLRIHARVVTIFVHVFNE